MMHLIAYSKDENDNDVITVWDDETNSIKQFFPTATDLNKSGAVKFG